MENTFNIGDRVNIVLPEFQEIYGKDRVYVIDRFKEDNRGKRLYVVHFEGFNKVVQFQFHEQDMRKI